MVVTPILAATESKLDIRLKSRSFQHCLESLCLQSCSSHSILIWPSRTTKIEMRCLRITWPYSQSKFAASTASAAAFDLECLKRRHRHYSSKPHPWYIARPCMACFTVPPSCSLLLSLCPHIAPPPIKCMCFALLAPPCLPSALFRLISLPCLQSCPAPSKLPSPPNLSNACSLCGRKLAEEKHAVPIVQWLSCLADAETRASPWYVLLHQPRNILVGPPKHLTGRDEQPTGGSLH